MDIYIRVYIPGPTGPPLSVSYPLMECVYIGRGVGVLALHDTTTLEGIVLPRRQVHYSDPVHDNYRLPGAPYSPTPSIDILVPDGVIVPVYVYTY